VSPAQEVGTAASVPFQLVNHGKDTEEFTLEATLPSGVEGMIIQGLTGPSQYRNSPCSPVNMQNFMIAFKMPATVLMAQNGITAGQGHLNQI
jgi:hypothetical protein